MPEETRTIVEANEIMETDINEPIKGEVVKGQVIEIFNEQVELFETRKHVLFRLTVPSDWITHNDHTADIISWGAERIMRPFGFNWGRPEFSKVEYEDTKGKYYVWEVNNLFRCKNPQLKLDFEIWAWGSCSSRNKLYALRWDANKKAKILLPVEEVNEQNVKRHAWSSCIRSAIGTGLGLRQLPREIFPEGWWPKINHVVYSEGKEGGQKTDERFLRDEISRMLREMYNRDGELMKKELVRFSSYISKDGQVFDGVDHPNNLSGWRLQKTYENIINEYKKIKEVKQ